MNTLDKRAAEARRAYQKAWRSKNRDKIKQYNAEYWKRRAAKLQESEESEGNPQ